MTLVETGTRARIGAVFGTPPDGEMTWARSRHRGGPAGRPVEDPGHEERHQADGLNNKLSGSGVNV